MKKLYILIFLFSNLYAQEPAADFEILNCKPVKGNFLWAAETELSNFQYLEFITSLKNNNQQDKYTKMLPDTTKWSSSLQHNQPYVDFYFRHPAYRNYPVVNITKEQANAYCEWLEKILNERYASDPKHPVQKVDVRLPTDEEWQTAARGGNPNAIFPWEGETMRRTDKKWAGDMRANFVRGRGDYMGVAGRLNDNADVTAPVKSYWPNNFGLYNMSGNVAEMVQEGRTRGGAWRTRAPFLEINGPDYFEGITEANPAIGFRYFIEIVDFKPVKKSGKTALNAKMIEDLLVATLNENNIGFYTSKYEVTNQLYNYYLEENPEAKKPNSQLWKDVVPYSSRYINDYSTHADYANFPVVNISKEEAVDFCNWLTITYNSFPKKKYENIEFRLPKEEEWETFAKGGLKLSPYPWGGPYIRNSIGNYLCNFRPGEDRWIMDDSAYLKPGLSQEEIIMAGNLDGFLITAPVDSYFPNDFGLYCASGNVSEMILDQDITKGGSWKSEPRYTQITAKEPYVGPSPYVGFRIVGEIKK